MDELTCCLCYKSVTTGAATSDGSIVCDDCCDNLVNWEEED